MIRVPEPTLSEAYQRGTRRLFLRVRRHRPRGKRADRNAGRCKKCGAAGFICAECGAPMDVGCSCPPGVISCPACSCPTCGDILAVNGKPCPTCQPQRGEPHGD